MSVYRHNYAAATLNGKIYVAGGRSEESDVCLSIVECYDPIEDVWTVKSSMNHAREGFSLIESSGMLYAMGSHEKIEQYNPDQNVWTVVRELWMR